MSGNWEKELNIYFTESQLASIVIQVGLLKGLREANGKGQWGYWTSAMLKNILYQDRLDCTIVTQPPNFGGSKFYFFLILCVHKGLTWVFYSLSLRLVKHLFWTCQVIMPIKNTLESLPPKTKSSVLNRHCFQSFLLIILDLMSYVIPTNQEPGNRFFFFFKYVPGVKVNIGEQHY